MNFFNTTIPQVQISKLHRMIKGLNRLVTPYSREYVRQQTFKIDLLDIIDSYDGDYLQLLDKVNSYNNRLIQEYQNFDITVSSVNLQKYGRYTARITFDIIERKAFKVETQFGFNISNRISSPILTNITL